MARRHSSGAAGHSASWARQDGFSLAKVSKYGWTKKSVALTAATMPSATVDADRHLVTRTPLRRPDSAVRAITVGLALGDTPFLLAAAYTLVAAQLLQTVLLGGWLLTRDAAIVAGVLRAWRASLFAGFMGAAASAGWFTAMAIEPVAHVRTLGLIELLFSYAISRRVFRERLRRRELVGVALLAVALVVVTLRR